MLLNAAESQTLVLFGNVNGFDILMIAFTIVIAYGVTRSILAPKKNKFAITFGAISLFAFIVMDAVMVRFWMS